MSYQKFIVAGNVVRDPELRYTPNTNTPLVELTVAVSERRKQGDKWENMTEFFEFTVWGKTAEIVAEYATKGRPVLVEGRLNKEQWENSEGQKRSNWRFTAENVRLLGGGNSNGGGTSKAKDEVPDNEDIPF